MKIPNVENEVSKSAGELDIRSQYDNTPNWGEKRRTTNRKVTIKSSGTNPTVYGSKALMTRENQTFIAHLIAEADDNDKLSMLPEIVIGEIRGNIRKGAKDLEQQWANALELVHKAYEVASVRTPTPEKKGAWQQYEELIKFGVKQLAATRGLDGKWRSANVLVREGENKIQQLAKQRFFVEVPGERAQEVDATNMDDIIDAITNKVRSSRDVRGAKVRVQERTEQYAVLVVLVDNAVREKIVIKSVS